MIDFLTLQRPRKPNNFLACTDDHCPDGAAQMIAPVYERPMAEVKAAWDAVIAAQPRVEQTAVSADGWQVEYVQRSKVLRFKDTITVRFVAGHDGSDGALGDNLSEGSPMTRVLVYSRASLGQYDFGVNRRRVETWLAALETALKNPS